MTWAGADRWHGQCQPEARGCKRYLCTDRTKATAISGKIAATQCLLKLRADADVKGEGVSVFDVELWVARPSLVF